MNRCQPLANVMVMPRSRIWSSVKCCRSASWKAGSMTGRAPVIRSAKRRAIFVRSGKSDDS